MKFHFKNIGPINEAELELGNLTIIAGLNNTGKTYLVYTLYGFLKDWKDWPGINNFLQDRTKNSLAKNQPVQTFQGATPFISIEQLAAKLIQHGQYEYAISREALNNERRAMISVLTREFSELRIPRIFSSPTSAFENASISVDFDDDFPQAPIRLTTEYATSGSISIEYREEGVTFSLKRLGKKRIRPDEISWMLSFAYLQFLLGELPEPFIISAERFGISLFYKELDFTKNRLVEMLQELRDEKGSDRISPYMLIDKTASRYALPIKDNIDYTRSISDLVKKKSKLEGTKLHDDVKHIMGGYYKSDDNDIRFVSKARKDRRFDIPLHLASSSARGLSDLYFYLRHKAERNHLLMIDEPESHLDTKNQVLLARMLSHIIRSGIKVLLTTHSDYLLKEVNNLIMLSNPFRGKDNLINKLKYRVDEYIPPESLRCYVAENGQLSRCEVDKSGVDIPVFDQTIDAINETSYELSSRLENAIVD